MEEEEIAAVIDGFAEAAGYAMAGGLDGVEWPRVEAHVEACPACQETLAGLSDDAETRRWRRLVRDDLSALVEVVRRLRPLAQMAVDAELARAMERLTLAFATDQMAHLVDPARLTGRAGRAARPA